MVDQMLIEEFKEAVEVGKTQNQIIEGYQEQLEIRDSRIAGQEKLAKMQDKLVKMLKGEILVLKQIVVLVGEALIQVGRNRNEAQQAIQTYERWVQCIETLEQSRLRGK